MALPTVAVAGYPNAGESTLFSRIVSERISIVENVEGVTRDRIYATGEWLDRRFSLIDTGGVDDVDAPFMEQIEHQADIATTKADVIVFVASGKEGVTDVDEYVSKALYRTDEPAISVVSKVDGPGMRSDIYDFYSPDPGGPHPVSSVHGIDTGDVLDAIIKSLSVKEEDENPDIIKFSLIGRPDVGKSNLVNAVLDEERVIVSPIAGATRDAIDTSFTDSEGQECTMVDTAGMREFGKVYENIEGYSVVRSMRAIGHSDIVLMVINVEEGIREYGKRIVGFAHETGKGIIIVVSKRDAIEKNNYAAAKWREDICDQPQSLSYVSIIFISAATKQRLNKLPDMIKKTSASQNKRIPSAVFNDVVMDAIAVGPTPTDKGKCLKIFYSAQASVKPPTFVIFVNKEELMRLSYMRFLENRIRAALDFEGTPINLITHKRK